MLPVYRPSFGGIFDLDRLFDFSPLHNSQVRVRPEQFSSFEDDNSIEFRTFIPKSVDPESIEVVLKDGVLTIHMTKQQVESSRKIKVKHE